MALLTSELDQIRYELGWNNLTVGAEPYIGVAAIFDRVVAPYLRSGLITSSSTEVDAASAPTQVTLTLAAASGTNTQGDAVSVSVGDTLVVDVDARQELAIVQAVTGTDVDLLLSLAHTGTYPVTVQGGEAMLRQILRRCRAVSFEIEGAMSNAGLKKVDEIEFFQSRLGGSTVFDDLLRQQHYWRVELYRLLFGVGDRSLMGGGRSGGLISVY